MKLADFGFTLNFGNRLAWLLMVLILLLMRVPLIVGLRLK